MGKFVMVDGLDGAGKGVAVTALREYCESKGMKILDMREYWKENEGWPDISEYDVIISAEPTFTGIGKKIREEIIKNGTKYSPQETAEAFAADRMENYKKLILPALEEDKWVFQERGVVTSLVYQPIMEGKSVELNLVKELEGNKFCLNHPPDILVIVVADPEAVINRLGSREKQDDAIFEKLDFQKKALEGYKSEWLRNLFEEKGAKVVYLDTSPPSKEEDTKKKIVEVFKMIEDCPL